MTLKDSFSWTSPYKGFWIQHYYSKFFRDIYGIKMVTEQTFRDSLGSVMERPEIMLMGNFIIDRSAITSLCRMEGINVVHGEDGFFPHYETMHADPLGFSWESSLSRSTFNHCSNSQRQISRAFRAEWLNRRLHELPGNIRKPFVLWPLQLLRDKVNFWDLGLASWNELITHFRQCLPSDYQLVIKHHPKSILEDQESLSHLARSLNNTIIQPREVDLTTLLHHCHAVAGANSTVLYEARLMHHKPVYAYARSWYTNHDDLFMPVRRQTVRPLPRMDWLVEPSRVRNEWLDDYTDWFLYQLLRRQINRPSKDICANAFKEQVWRLSYQSLIRYGQDIFD